MERRKNTNLNDLSLKLKLGWYIKVEKLLILSIVFLIKLFNWYNPTLTIIQDVGKGLAIFSGVSAVYNSQKMTNQQHIRLVITLFNRENYKKYSKLPPSASIYLWRRFLILPTMVAYCKSIFILFVDLFQESSAFKLTVRNSPLDRKPANSAAKRPSLYTPVSLFALNLPELSLART